MLRHLHFLPFNTRFLTLISNLDYSRRADVNLVDTEGCTALHHAASEIFLALVYRNRCNHMRVHVCMCVCVCVPVRHMRARVFLSASVGCDQTSGVVLESHSCVWMHVCVSPHPTISVCAGYGHAGCASLLLSYGIDVNTQDRKKRTPLRIAAQFAHFGNLIV
jgi:hypothetical protein